MIIYTIGFTQKSAKQFFELIKKNKICSLIDVRLNNQSQLAGFTKGRDLPYFLKNIADCEYYHELDFAPTEDILKDYKKGVITWDEYEKRFHKLVVGRDMPGIFERKYGRLENTVLLCSEVTAQQCHRRLVAEAISEKYGYKIIHL